MSRYVLSVESIPNWKHDSSGGFQYLGLSDRRRGLFDSLAPRDLIITYVKSTGFVDVREITAAGATRLTQQNYPIGVYPWQVRTRLVASLGLEGAINPGVFKGTRLCSGSWWRRFQHAGEVIEQDGRTIAQAIISKASDNKSSG